MPGWALAWSAAGVALLGAVLQLYNVRRLTPLSSPNALRSR
jgi:hypothetical protein